MSYRVEVVFKFLVFICQYNLIKCLKTMLAGLLLMPFIFIIRAINRGKNANVNFYSLLMLLPMVFTGMSELFYKRHSYKITFYIHVISGSKRFSIFYWMVAVALLVAFIYRNLRVGKWARRLEKLEAEGLRERAFDIVASDVSKGFRKKYLQRVEIYVTEHKISPFSSGIIKPYIVVPQSMFEEADDEEQLMMLCHEYMHIKAGHIVWLTLFKLLCIYWWINPIMHILTKRLYEDMEMSCDERCIQHAKILPYNYSVAILNAAKRIQPKEIKGVVPFVAKNDYGRIKKRINYLKDTNVSASYKKRQRMVALAFTICILAMLIFIKHFSYPRYVVDMEPYLYDENLTLRITDYDDIKKAVSIKKGELVIDHAEFKKLLDAYKIKGEHVYISYGMVIKIPGVGGGGNTGMVSTSDYDDILYLAGDSIENDIMIFVLKYIL